MIYFRNSVLMFLTVFITFPLALGCGDQQLPQTSSSVNAGVPPTESLDETKQSEGDFTPLDGSKNGPFLAVLGITQDAGYPQAACQKECCRSAWQDPTQRRHPVCLAIVDQQAQKRWMVECTPEFPEQLQMLDKLAPAGSPPGLDGILLTHAHIGHYAGLIHLGREVIGADCIPVYAMPRMQAFLTENGPWSQLVSLDNIDIRPLESDKAVDLSPTISVTPIHVPHRGEYSETVAYLIAGPNRRVLFLPDIDKWEKWDRRVEDVVATVDVAFLDGSFFDGDELPGRDMSEIPHPFIIESMSRFANLPAEGKAKIRFIHFNHTNDALRSGSEAARQIRDAGFHIAEQGERVEL
ncbi:MAG: MBL fold metallo-hydrolase [Pirellulales bacterium]|nr:MBL fold metallo-hydrolase [Pirellulales bacterium]